jgi:hypothetical protein
MRFAYTFSVDRIEVVNCRSRGDHNDDDWLDLSITIDGQGQQGGVFFAFPNAHAGQSVNGPWSIGPFVIDDNQTVLTSFTITNLSGSDRDKQQGEAVRIGLGIDSALLAIAAVGAFIAEEELLAAVTGGVAGVLSGLAELLGWAVGNPSNPNCNGEVFSQSFVFSSGDLSRLGTHTVDASGTTSAPDSNCGAPPHTNVKYTVIRQAVVESGARQISGLSTAPGATSLYLVGLDAQVWSKFFPDAGNPGHWSSWFALGPNTFPENAAITALSTGPGATTLYVVGKDGQVWSTFFPDAGNPGHWSGWFALGPNTFPENATTTALSTGPGATSLYVVGKDGQVWSNFFPAAGNPGHWSGWFALGPNSFPENATITALSTGPGATALYVVGKDGQVWSNFFPAAGNPGHWSGWFALGPNTFPENASITALSTGPGATSLYVAGKDGKVWSNFFPAAGNPGHWSGWFALSSD